MTAYFNLGENIGSWVVFTNMKKIVQIVPISVYLRRRKFTGCHCHYWTPVYCNSQVVLEIQQHVRIRTFVGSIWNTRAPQTIGNHQRPISDDTVRRWLITNTIRCRRLTRRPILTVHRRQERLQWTTQCQDWRH